MFIKKIQISLLTTLSLSLSFNCFSGTPPKKEEKLICNQHCQSAERIIINQFNTTEIDLSGMKDVVKNIIDKKMKISGNVTYGVKGDPIPGGTVSSYSKLEKDNKRLLTKSRRGNSSNIIPMNIIFRQNECNKNSIDIDIRLLASDYMFYDVVKCSGSGADVVACVNSTLINFAENELSEYLFKEPKTYNF